MKDSHKSQVKAMHRELEKNKEEANKILEVVDPTELNMHLMRMIEAGKLVPIEDVKADWVRHDPRVQASASIHHDRTRTAPISKNRPERRDGRSPSRDLR